MEWREKMEAFMKRNATTKIKDLRGATTESVRAVYEGHINKLRAMLLQIPVGGGKVDGMSEADIKKGIERYTRLAATFEMPEKSK